MRPASSRNPSSGPHAHCGRRPPEPILTFVLDLCFRCPLRCSFAPFGAPMCEELGLPHPPSTALHRSPPLSKRFAHSVTRHRCLTDPLVILPAARRPGPPEVSQFRPKLGPRASDLDGGGRLRLRLRQDNRAGGPKRRRLRKRGAGIRGSCRNPSPAGTMDDPPIRALGRPWTTHRWSSIREAPEHTSQAQPGHAPPDSEHLRKNIDTGIGARQAT